MRAVVGAACALGLLASSQPLLAQAADPAAAKAKIEEARTRLGSGEIDKAIALFREAVRLDPDNAPAHNALGSLLNRAGRYGEALPHAEAAARLAPEDARYRYNRGVVRAEHGKFTEAIADFDFALNAQPGLTYAWLERGAAKLSTGDTMGAQADFAEAAKTDAKLIWPVWYVASGHFVDGRYAEAAAGFDRVAEAEAGFVPAKLWRWIAHGRAGNPITMPDAGSDEWPAPVVSALRGAIAAERLLAIAEQDGTTGDKRRLAEALYFLAQHALIRGDKAAAAGYLRRALSIPTPRHVWRIAAERDLKTLQRR